jgi:hypothetical protein
LQEVFSSALHDFSQSHFPLVAFDMTTNASKDAMENVTKDPTIDETASNDLDESWDESSNDSENESDNEGTIVYDEVTTLSDDFDRLRWSVFDDVSKIQVYEDLSNKRTSKLSPFHSHPIAKSSATDPPCHKIAFDLDAFSHIETPGYRSPNRCMVCRADGGIVTIADVVGQLSPYLIANEEDIFWVVGTTLQFDPPMGPYKGIPANTKLYFEGFSPTIIDEGYYAIEVILDVLRVRRKFQG